MRINVVGRNLMETGVGSPGEMQYNKFGFVRVDSFQSCNSETEFQTMHHLSA